MKVQSWNKSRRHEASSILCLCGSWKTILPALSHINVQLNVHHVHVSVPNVSSLCGLGTALIKKKKRPRFIQRINTLTFGRFEGTKKKKKKSMCTMVALQQLKATRRVKSTVPFSVHSCLGRHGDSREDPNMGPRFKNKERDNLHCCCRSQTQSEPILPQLCVCSVASFLRCPIKERNIRESLWAALGPQKHCGN